MKCFVFLLLFTCCTPAAESLFNGSSLDHWSGKAEHWRVEDGVITGEIPTGKKLNGNEWIFWTREVHAFEHSVVQHCRSASC